MGYLQGGGQDQRVVGELEGADSVVLNTSRTRSGLAKVTFAIAGTSMPWADSRTICARRHLTTDPEDRRTILNRTNDTEFQIMTSTRRQAGRRAPSTANLSGRH